LFEISYGLGGGGAANADGATIELGEEPGQTEGAAGLTDDEAEGEEKGGEAAAAEEAGDTAGDEGEGIGLMDGEEAAAPEEEPDAAAPEEAPAQP